MKNGWIKTTLGDLCDKGQAMIQTGPFGSQLHSYDYLPMGVPVIPTEAIRRRRISGKLLPRVSEETVSRLARHKLKAGDILFARRGAQATGLSALVEPKHQGWLCGTGAILLRLQTSEVDPTFLSFVLSSEATILWLKTHAVGAVMPNLNEGVLRRLPLVLPPYRDQCAIAQLLGTLDEKIELSRQMNATLEELALNIFKSLFIDKMHADSTLWRESTIGAELTTLLGGTPSRSEPSYWEGGIIPWINSGEANEFRVTEPSEFITKAGLENSSTKLLPLRTTIIAITGATLGKVSLLEIEACANQSIVGVIGSERIPNEFVYFWVKEYIEDLLSWQTGGAQQHINKDNVNALRIVCPPEDMMRTYLQAVRPLFDLIKNNCLECRTLATLRDALLPRLLSGEMRAINTATLSEELSHA